MLATSELRRVERRCSRDEKIDLDAGRHVNQVHRGPAGDRASNSIRVRVERGAQLGQQRVDLRRREIDQDVDILREPWFAAETAGH